MDRSVDNTKTIDNNYVISQKKVSLTFKKKRYIAVKDNKMKKDFESEK